MEECPERATSVGYSGHDHRWTDLSLEAIDRRAREAGELVGAIDAIDRPALTEDDQLSYDLFRRDNQQLVETSHFPGELMPFSRMEGVHLNVPRTIDRAPRERIGDLDNVVARLSGVSVLVDQIISLLNEDWPLG